MKLFFLLPVLLLYSTGTSAQHCPFDGYHLLAIKVVNKQGNMITNYNTPFYLLEVDNPMADSCTSAVGLIRKQLIPKDTFIASCNAQFDRNGYNRQLYSRLTKAGVFANANMMVNLNQAENTCTLIGKSETVYTNYIYRQRKFVIVYTINNEEVREKVPDDLIYSLCTAAKEIEKFKPVIIKIQ
jgi:hypothetical protein